MARSFRWRLPAAALPLLLLAACQGWVRRSDDCGECDEAAARREPHVSHQPSLMAVAHDLDHLEKHIDWYGSITAKTPDIWGQARLTRYREEIETELRDELSGFKLYLNGQVSRSDQAFLASATTLSLAASPRAAVAAATAPMLPNTTTETKTTYLTPPLTQKTRTVTETEYKGDKETKKTETKEEMAQAVEKPAAPPAPEAPKPKEAKDAADAVTLVGDPETLKAISRTEGRKVTTVGIGGQFEDQIGLEPVEYLNQKKRYLEYLSQLRRENEGDDTADSPGYALNLMRIPVSVLPGKKTDTGHGAEITITIDPVLCDELLPTTFRDLMTNDLVKQLGFPLTKFLSEKANRDLLADPVMRLATRDLDGFKAVISLLAVDREAFVATAKQRWVPELQQRLEIAQLERAIQDDREAKEMIAEAVLNAPDKAAGKAIIDDLIVPIVPNQPITKSVFAKGLEFEGGEFRYSSRSDPLTRKTIPKSVANTKSGLDEATKKAADALQTQTRFEATVNRLTGKLNELTSSLNSVRVPFATGSRTRQPIPASQFFEVYGSAFPFEVAYRANQALGSEIAARGYAHLPDVQSFLKTEIDAAYRLLAHDTERAFWDRFCTEEMAHLIHSRNGVRLKNERDEFRRMFQQVAESQGQPDPERQGEYSSTAAFVWAMLLDAALLNTRLVQDLKETASAKGLVLACDRWPAFYLPDPPAEARAAFAQYVKARWPIHVFALDPETNDQNIADALSLRRESQFALALAFAGGQINANQFNRYVRRLEGEYETVALNRTQVGFSHGENTFGWRFYPRFQTPATRGNLTVIARDQLWGGPTTNQLLRERRLEPGPRECTALVIMPSFVPNVTLDVAGNWFALANPKHKVFDHTQALHLSRTVQAIRTDGCGVKDAHKYRDTDHRLLLARAEQLSARLPLQAMAAQVPTNDNLSGFELFVNGASSLAPQLYGWYGAPGVKEGEDTTLFLVGDHFSVTQTRVLAGNREVPTDRRHMISRQVMQVTVPWNAIPRENNHVQINVATPYGVSQELVVPVVPKAADPPAAVSAPITAEIVYDKKGAGDGSYWLDYPRAGAKAVAWLQWPDATSPPDKVDAVLTFKAAGCNLTVELKGLAVHGGLVPLDRKQLELVADQLFRGFNGLRPSTDDTNPLANGLTTDSVRLLPRTLQGDGTLSSPDANKAKASATQLTLTFRCRVPVPPERLPNPRPGDGAADVGGAFEKGPSKNTPNSPVPMQNLPPGDLPNPPVLKTTPLPAPQANPVPASPIPTPTPVPGPVTPPPPDLPAIPLAPAGDLVPPAEPSAGQRPPVLPIPRKEG